MLDLRAGLLALVLGGVAACGSGSSDAARASSGPERTTSTATALTTTAPPVTTTTPATSTSTAPTTTPSRGTTATATPDPSPPTPPFESRVSAVTATELSASWRPGCPVPVADLRALDVSHWGFDGRVHTGRLVVAASLAQPVVDVLADLYAQHYPIERMEPIDVYGGDDNASISANNTSGFNCRKATGGSSWSEHAYGRAIDVNPFVNPYVKGSTVLPPEAAPYADRTRHDPGMIHADDAVVRAFAARGFRWGGYWRSLKDYQHFSTTGR